jgi:hypothetical protein
MVLSLLGSLLPSGFSRLQSMHNSSSWGDMGGAGGTLHMRALPTPMSPRWNQGQPGKLGQPASPLSRAHSPPLFQAHVTHLIQDRPQLCLSLLQSPCIVYTYNTKRISGPHKEYERPDRATNPHAVLGCKLLYRTIPYCVSSRALAG